MAPDSHPPSDVIVTGAPASNPALRARKSSSVAPSSAEPRFEPFQATGFAACTGPILRQYPRGNRFRLAIADHHLNSAGRFHGGMAMTLQKVAFDQVAFETALGMSPGSMVELVTINCDFVGPADAGDCIEARAVVTRATRSILFLTGQIAHGNRQILTASAIYKIAEVTG